VKGRYQWARRCLVSRLVLLALLVVAGVHGRLQMRGASVSQTRGARIEKALPACRRFSSASFSWTNGREADLYGPVVLLRRSLPSTLAAVTAIGMFVPASGMHTGEPMLIWAARHPRAEAPTLACIRPGVRDLIDAMLPPSSPSSTRDSLRAGGGAVMRGCLHGIHEAWYCVTDNAVTCVRTFETRRSTKWGV